MNLQVVKWARPWAGAGIVVLLAAIALLMWSAEAARAATAPTFEVVTHAWGLGPTWVEPIDVTGDGNLDLVVANGDDDTVSVSAGDGEGDFGPATFYSCGGDNPYSLDVAELTGDDVLDIAVANRTSSTVTVLKGDGAGGFTLLRSLVVGTETIDVKALDLDDDGDLDLATSQMWNSPTHDHGTLWLLYNNGSGRFTTVDMPLPYDGGTVLGVGDLNEDGSVDVAVGHSYMAVTSVLLNDGLGRQLTESGWPISNLVLGSQLAVGSYPQGAVFADFDADGHMDICVTSRYPNNANIFFGDGTGTFTGPTRYAVGAYAKVPVAVDLNRDGALDLAISNYGDEGAGQTGGTTISILTGIGDGTFNAQSTIEVGVRPHSVGVGDFNEDGWPDLAVPNWASDDVSVLLNTTFYASDKLAPVTTSSADGAWHRTSVNVTLAATDALSGVASTHYRVDGAGWQTGKSFSVSGDGVHAIEFYSVDNAGNTEGVKSAQVKIDGTAPSVTLTTPQDGAYYVQGSVATSAWTSDDPLSGVASETATIDGVGIVKGARIDTLPFGPHAFSLTVTDAAGNQRTVTADYSIPLPHSTTFASVSRTSTIMWGKSTIVRATLLEIPDSPLGDKVVGLEWSPDRATWAPVDDASATVRETATGEYEATVAAKLRTYYRFVYVGDGYYGAAESGPILVKVKPVLSRPRPPKTSRVNRTFTVSGTLKPRFPARARTVTIKVVRYNGSRWVSYKTYKARNVNSGSYTKYSLKLRIARKGAFRFKASIAATTQYASTSTAYSRTLRIR